eukprot:Blabericola_migrator_1__8668@NODE_4552_length_1093_cov_6_620858_g2824_i0_p1_GENE_NODE_4552_length_1093_cov_6_620858_g2824_i0NODE_4552_length_1093_cov_6_620858_g2824_i0_p1_ORF_typecomplete_len148_score10_35_NODE_4552_length_1093_cov_6_620858_g2824_i0206649
MTLFIRDQLSIGVHFTMLLSMHTIHSCLDSQYFKRVLHMLSNYSSPDDIVDIDSTATSTSLSFSSNSRPVLSSLNTLTLVLSRLKNTLFTVVDPFVPDQRATWISRTVPSYSSSFLGFQAPSTPVYLNICVTPHSTPLTRHIFQHPR